MTGQYDALKFKVKESKVQEFVQSLQAGFYLKSPVGIYVMEFLTDICGVSHEYIAENVKTVSKPALKAKGNTATYSFPAHSLTMIKGKVK